MSYLHDNQKTQYILLFYHLYNLISYRLGFLNIFDELAMITFGTHAITKKGDLCRTPIRLNMSKSLCDIASITLGQVVDDLLRNLPQLLN